MEKLQIKSRELADFIKQMNDLKSISDVLDKVFISESGFISVTELFQIFFENYETLKKEMLANFIKSLDNKQNGLIEYPHLYKVFKKFISPFDSSIFLHSRYLNYYIKKTFVNNSFKEYIISKNLTSSLLNYQEFSKVVSEDVFNDENLTKKYYEKLKDKTSEKISFQLFTDLIKQLSYDNINLNSDLAFNSNTLEKDNSANIKDILTAVENKKMSFINIFEVIEVKDLNASGKISTSIIRSILKENYKIDDEEIEQVCLYFSKLNTLFDLNKLTSFIQKNLTISVVKLEDIRAKFKTAVKKSDIKKYEQFLLKFNLKPKEAYNLIDVLNLFVPIFKITRYECFVLYNFMIRLETNPDKNNNIFTIDLLFNEFWLKKYFTETAKDKEQPKDEKENKTKDLLLKLYDYVTKHPNINELYYQYDRAKKGYLFGNDFLDFIGMLTNKTFDDKEKKIVLKYADKNKDDIVDYKEFLAFLKEIKESGEQYEKIRSSRNLLKKSTTTGFRVKIEVDYQLMKINHEKNIKFIKEIEGKKFNYALFKLQKEYLTEFNNFDNIEKEFSNYDTDYIYVIARDEFMTVCNKRNVADDPTAEEKLYNFTLENLDTHTKNRLMSEKKVDYRRFLKNLAEYNYQSRVNPELKEKIENDTKIKLDKLKASRASRKPEESKNQMPYIVTNKVDQTSPSKKDLASVKSSKKDNVKVNKGTNSNKDNKKSKFLNEENTKESNEVKRSEKIKLPKLDSPNEVYISALDKKINFTKDDEVIEIINFMYSPFIQQIKNKTITGSIDKLTNQEKDEINKILIERCTKHKTLELAINQNDYFIFPSGNGRVLKTILNSEEAALAACEYLYNSLEENQTFIDHDFGSQTGDKDILNCFSNYFDIITSKTQIPVNRIEWYKPEDIAKEPTIFKNIEKTNQVVQGNLGDSWLLSAFGILGSKEKSILSNFNLDDIVQGTNNLSEGVYPPIFHFYRRKKIYCFRYFKMNSWKYVIVDDRLPCIKVQNPKMTKPKLLYCKSRDNNEFWISLLEKGFAKLSGCYESLKSGLLEEGLVDLTGKGYYKIEISESPTEEEKDEKWNFLNTNCNSPNSIVACSVEYEYRKNEPLNQEVNNLIILYRLLLIKIKKLELSEIIHILY